MSERCRMMRPLSFPSSLSLSFSLRPSPLRKSPSALLVPPSSSCAESRKQSSFALSRSPERDAHESGRVVSYPPLFSLVYPLSSLLSLFPVQGCLAVLQDGSSCFTQSSVRCNWREDCMFGEEEAVLSCLGYTSLSLSIILIHSYIRRTINMKASLLCASAGKERRRDSTPRAAESRGVHPSNFPSLLFFHIRRSRPVNAQGE